MSSTTDKDTIKLLIKISHTVEEIDEILEQNTDFKTYGEKLAYLRGLYRGHKILDKRPENLDELAYYNLIVSTIINEY